MATPKMKVTDVKPDTRYEIQRERSGYAHIHALKPCGCDGPWLGTIRKVPYPEWTLEMMTVAEGRVGYLWEIFPVLRSDPYKLAKRPVGYAVGTRTAAQELINYIAERNAA